MATTQPQSQGVVEMIPEEPSARLDEAGEALQFICRNIQGYLKHHEVEACFKYLDIGSPQLLSLPWIVYQTELPVLGQQNEEVLT